MQALEGGQARPVNWASNALLSSKERKRTMKTRREMLVGTAATIAAPSMGLAQAEPTKPKQLVINASGGRHRGWSGDFAVNFELAARGLGAGRLAASRCRSWHPASIRLHSWRSSHHSTNSSLPCSYRAPTSRYPEDVRQHLE